MSLDLEAYSNLEVLKDRARWLEVRIKAKQSINWDTKYDERELRGLKWAIKKLEPSHG
jgi:hypothetical protein